MMPRPNDFDLDGARFLLKQGARFGDEHLAAHSNRPPPPGSWRDFSTPTVDERGWEEFEYARAADPQAEAGHA